ncbi:MAG: nucleotidyltransferase domain-containing protein [Gammaproteobacteria bacterium]|nr:nucleotidyltransferase domain-containing protein [Gammaproteobacteria bacterium]
MTELDGFLAALRPLLDARNAHGAWIFGSHARGTAGDESDIDVIVVAPTERAFVERFRDYLPAIVDARVGVDLLVYTPEEFAQMQGEERPFLVDALAGARRVYVGREGRS